MPLRSCTLWMVALVAAPAVAAGCGAAAPSGAASTAPSGAASPAPSPARSTAASCSKVLTPWTQYIADSDDFRGWVDTVGAHSPIVALPQNAARVYLAEQTKSGAQAASTDGFADLDRACTTFAAAHPSFNFHNVPPAPELTSN